MMTKNEIAELQKQISREAYRRYEAAHGKTIKEMDAEIAARSASSNEAKTKMQDPFAAYRAKYPHGQAKVEYTPGPQHRQALALVEAVRKLKAGQAGEASHRDGYLGVVSLPGGA